MVKQPEREVTMMSAGEGMRQAQQAKEPKGVIGPRGIKGVPASVPRGGILVEIVEKHSKQPNQCVKRLFRAS